MFNNIPGQLYPESNFTVFRVEVYLNNGPNDVSSIESRLTWCTLRILSFGKVRQENFQFEVSQVYIG